MRIIGALGPGQLSPLLIEEEAGLFVATRPAPEALARCRSVHVVAARRLLEMGDRKLALAPYVEGRDLDEILEEGPLDRPLDVLEQVLAAVAAAGELGVSHGALRNACIRVSDTGVVRVVDWRGAGKDDVERLRELVTEWADDPRGLLERLDRPLESTQSRGPEVFPHPFTGAELGAETPARVPRVQLAGTAALTLLLGLGSGWVLFGAGAAPQVEIVVADAVEVVADCDQLYVRATGNRLVLPVHPATCTMLATSKAGSSVRGRVRVSLPGTLTCREKEGELTCSAP